MDLILYTPDDTDLSGLLDAAADARALADIVNDAKKHVDSQLRTKVEQLSEATGTAFTGRHDGYSVALTDPQPKPVVTDRDKFARWLRSVGHPVPVRDTPVVRDAPLVAAVLEQYDDMTTSEALVAFEALVDSGLAVHTEFLLPEDPFAGPLDAGQIVVTADGVVDTSTGEIVPGTSVKVAAPQLRVVGTKDAKQARRRRIEQTLGLSTPELEQ